MLAVRVGHRPQRGLVVGDRRAAGQRQHARRGVERAGDAVLRREAEDVLAGDEVAGDATVAPARFALSASVTVRPVSIAVAPLPSVNASADAVIVTTGAWLAATTDASAVTVAAPPVPVSASLYDARTVSPLATFSGAALFVPADGRPQVVSVPLKIPVLTPVSVSVTVSHSLVRVLMTVTCTGLDGRRIRVQVRDP